MEYKNKYTKEQAIENAEKFLAEVRKLEEKYSMIFNSDRGDIYLSYKPSEETWDTVDIGWDGDDTGLKVKEKIVDKRAEALAKLSEEDRKILGLE